MPTMTLSFFKAFEPPESRRYLNSFRRHTTRMTRSLSASIACAAAATSLASASAFVAPQISHVPTSYSPVPRAMPDHTIMGVATSDSASATLLTDTTAAASTSGLADIDDNNFQELFGGEKAVLIDACAPVS